VHRTVDRRIDRQHQRDQGGRHGHGRGPVRLAVPRVQRVSSQFEGDKFDKERAVFSVHGEPFTVVARAESGIESFDDLNGKRVNVGNPGSGQRATMEVVLDAKGWTSAIATSRSRPS
jgi:hypothetical protein